MISKIINLILNLLKFVFKKYDNWEHLLQIKLHLLYLDSRKCNKIREGVRRQQILKRFIFASITWDTKHLRCGSKKQKRKLVSSNRVYSKSTIIYPFHQNHVDVLGPRVVGIIHCHSHWQTQRHAKSRFTLIYPTFPSICCGTCKLHKWIQTVVTHIYCAHLLCPRGHHQPSPLLLKPYAKRWCLHPFHGRVKQT